MQREQDSRCKTVLIILSGHGNVVKLLQEKGANINEHDSDGNSALHIATQQGKTLFMDSNCNFSIFRQSKIFTDSNALLDYENVVELLIEEGADINIKNIYGNPPLYYAVSKGSYGKRFKNFRSRIVIHDSNRDQIEYDF